jgi:hypothetical protein
MYHMAEKDARFLLCISNQFSSLFPASSRMGFVLSRGNDMLCRGEREADKVALPPDVIEKNAQPS